MVESLLVGRSPARRVCCTSFSHVALYVLLLLGVVLCGYSTAVGSRQCDQPLPLDILVTRILCTWSSYLCVRYNTVNSLSVPKNCVTVRCRGSEGGTPRFKFCSDWRYLLHFYSVNTRKTAHCTHGIEGSKGLRTSNKAEEERKYRVPTEWNQSLILAREATSGCRRDRHLTAVCQISCVLFHNTDALIVLCVSVCCLRLICKEQERTEYSDMWYVRFILRG
jgi:hypothetical protein